MRRRTYLAWLAALLVFVAIGTGGGAGITTGDTVAAAWGAKTAARGTGTATGNAGIAASTAGAAPEGTVAAVKGAVPATRRIAAAKATAPATWRTMPAAASGPIFKPDGVWNPANEHQRYRAGEYPGDFFQWWYFAVSDAETATSFAFFYHCHVCPTNPALEGLYVIFVMFSPAGNFSVHHRYPLSAVASLGNEGHMSFAGGLHRIIPGPSGDSVRALGLLNDPASLWASSRSPGASDIVPPAVIGWDVTFTRLAGCYVVAELEGTATAPDLLWNTYQFDALVEGAVTIDGTPHVFGRDGIRFRGYCDQNFGVDMPHGDPAISHRWGWFSARRRHEDPARDVAIIAGAGLDDRAMGKHMRVEGVYAAASNALGRNVAWKQADGLPFRTRIPLARACSWGRSTKRLVSCQVTAEDWFVYSDVYGQASIPARQSVTLDGEYIRITMDVRAAGSGIHRLLLPYKRGLWSDFEALGAVGAVNVYEKAYRWYDVFRLFPVLILRDSFVDTQAGLEYGYFIPGITVSQNPVAR